MAARWLEGGGAELCACSMQEQIIFSQYLALKFP